MVKEIKALLGRSMSLDETVYRELKTSGKVNEVPIKFEYKYWLPEHEDYIFQNVTETRSEGEWKVTLIKDNSTPDAYKRLREKLPQSPIDLIPIIVYDSVNHTVFLDLRDNKIQVLGKLNIIFGVDRIIEPVNRELEKLSIDAYHRLRKP